MKTLTDINHVLAQINYKNCKFLTGKMGNGFYLQTSNENANNTYNNTLENDTQKWYLSPFVTKHELIQTALLAILANEEPAVLDQVTYQGGSYPYQKNLNAYQQNIEPITYSMHDLDF